MRSKKCRQPKDGKHGAYAPHHTILVYFMKHRYHTCPQCSQVSFSLYSISNGVLHVNPLCLCTRRKCEVVNMLPNLFGKGFNLNIQHFQRIFMTSTKNSILCNVFNLVETQITFKWNHIYERLWLNIMVVCMYYIRDESSSNQYFQISSQFVTGVGQIYQCYHQLILCLW